MCQVQELNDDLLAAMSSGPAHSPGATTAANAHNLVDLNLSINDLTDVARLRSLKWLRRLVVSFNQITTLSQPLDLTCLVNLDISHNALTAITPLLAATSLSRLNLSCNKLASLAGIEVLAELTVLIADDNSLTSIEPVSALGGLKELHVCKNQIANLSAVRHLFSLSILRISQNNIPDLPSTIATLAQLPMLTEVVLLDNPLCMHRRYRYDIVLKCEALTKLDNTVVSQVSCLISAKC